MTLSKAKSLKTGDIILADTTSAFFNRGGVNADGSPMRFKVTSVKTWKTRPEQVLIGLKRGLYDYAKINQDEIENFTMVG